MSVSKNLSLYIKEKGINLSALSRATGIKRGILHSSLSDTLDDNKRRPLRDDELVKICGYLDLNPMEFADKDINKEEWD